MEASLEMQEERPTLDGITVREDISAAELFGLSQTALRRLIADLDKMQW